MRWGNRTWNLITDGIFSNDCFYHSCKDTISRKPEQKLSHHTFTTRKKKQSEHVAGTPLCRFICALYVRRSAAQSVLVQLSGFMHNNRQRSCWIECFCIYVVKVSILYLFSENRNLTSLAKTKLGKKGLTQNKHSKAIELLLNAFFFSNSS